MIEDLMKVGSFPLIMQLVENSSSGSMILTHIQNINTVNIEGNKCRKYKKREGEKLDICP